MRTALLAAVLLSTSASLADDLPEPATVFGFEPGADGKLADWETHLRWYRALDEASPRVMLRSIGQSTLGREMVLLEISSPENLAARESIQADAALLADARRLPAERAAEICRDAKLVVLVSCGIHADEVGGSLMAARLAYDLAASDDPEVAEVLENVVVLLVPSMNPDGLDLIADWYRQSIGTPYEGGDMPWLYHDYAGHDNNRDWFMLNLAETRNLTRVLYREWFPRIVVDVHQMGRQGARMFVPPYVDPLNPNIDPLLVTETNFFGMKMAMDLSAAGARGVVQGVVFDNYWDGGLRNVPSRHNMVGILVEAASARLASPIFVEPDDLKGHGHALPTHEARGNFPDPWPGGWWRLGDVVRYQEAAVRSVLSLAAIHRPALLANGRRLSERAIADGRNEPPFAYVLPPNQSDPPTARWLLAVLSQGGVEVHRARSGFFADDVEYPAGSHVVLMSQPYRAHAKDLLEVQTWPAGTAPGGDAARPYDVAGWTLPLQMGVRCVEVRAPFEADLALGDPPEETGADLPEALAGGAWILPCRVNASFLVANRLLAAGVQVGRVVETAAGVAAPVERGDFLVPSAGAPAGKAMSEAVSGTGLEVARVEYAASLSAEWLDPVRLGVYQPWTASMDEGWTRWVLDEFRFPYRAVHDARIQAGDLRRDFDCLIVPNLSPGEILEGRSAKQVPSRYAGGIGRRGLENLVRFVEAGGRVVLLGKACPLAFGRSKDQVADALAPPAAGTPAETKDFACPGSILRARVETSHPLALGFGAEIPIYVSDGPILAVKGLGAVLTYPERDTLLSGWVRGEAALAGSAALVEVPDGEGRWILFAFRPQHRGQTHGTFRLLFNAIYRVSSRP